MERGRPPADASAEAIARARAPARLQSLRDYDILDTPPEQGFDDIVALAAQICGTPVALVSLVDADRQWFKARVGFEAPQTPLDQSVCVHALVHPGLLVIADLSVDPRTAANTLVTQPPFLRFYAGAPLIADDVVLGTLCVIDYTPRPAGLTAVQSSALLALAGQVTAQMTLRRALARRDALLARQDAVLATQRAVAAAGDDFDAVLQAIAEGALRAVPRAEGAVVGLRADDGLVYRHAAGTLRSFVGRHLPIAGTLTGLCVTSGEAILCPDTAADPRVRQDLVSATGVRACALVPVRRGTDVIGVLKVQSTTPDAFTEADLQTGELLTGIVTAAVADRGESQARRATEASESRYRAVFDSAISYAIVVLDLSGRISNWNEGAERIFGWSADEVRGQPVTMLFVPEDRAAGVAEREMGQALARGRGLDERWHLRKDGGRFWANGEMMALRDEAGTAIGFVKMLRDRTDQRQMRQALDRQTETLQIITDHVGQAVFQMDAAGLVTYVNPAAEQMFGWRSDELIGRNLHDVLHHSHPDGRPYPGQDCAFVQALGTGATIRDRDEVFFRKDGAPRAVLATSAPVMHNGQVASAVLTITDITERKAAEDRLAASEERWRGLFTGMQEGLFHGEVLRDATGRGTDFRFLDVNPGFERQTGLSAAATAGRTCREVVPGIADGLIETIAIVAETGRATTFETHVEPLGRWFEARARGEGGDRFVVMFIDVTARKRAELRQAALIDLGDRLRDLADGAAIAAAAGETVGRALAADWAGYGAVDPVTETVTIERAWCASGARGLDGVHRLADHGAHVEALRVGETVVVADVGHDARLHDGGGPAGRLGIRAFVDLPVIENGQCVALLFIAQRRPRAWLPEDIAFLRNVGDRTRAAAARVEAEQQRRHLNDELSHRMKNLLAMVQAIASQTLRAASDLAGARQVLAGRLVALGQAHDLLLSGATGSTVLRAVVEAAVRLHADRPERLVIEGPDLQVGAKVALALTLMLHELATNATKYGAFSNETGRVTVAWSIEAGPEPALRLRWQETGGPPVTPPSRTGFGSRFIERALAGQLGAEIGLLFPPEGVACTLTIALAAAQANV